MISYSTAHVLTRSVRIGVMLRTLSERQGIGIYTRNIIDHLLRIDSRNQYVFYYRDR